MDIKAPAKVNLYLKVLAKRPDGYHEIETLFERISIFDEVFVEISKNSTVITCDDPKIPVDKDSLLAKTINVFREEAGLGTNFTVKLKKNIPVGAGLGGGSSDSAALLLGLNRISGEPLNEEALMRIGGTLGSDIPFFISDSSFAYGKGRGELIEKIQTDIKIWHVLINPPFEKLTKDIYNAVPRLGLTKNGGVDRILSAFFSAGKNEELVKNLRNDLQTIVLQKFPELKKVFSELEKEGADGVLLSGSGPTVFGIFERDEAIKAAKRLSRVFKPEENWRVFAAETC